MTPSGQFTKCDFFPPLPVVFWGNWVLFFITAPPTVRVRECGVGVDGFLEWPMPHTGKRNLGELACWLLQACTWLRSSRTPRGAPGTASVMK